MAVDKYRTFKKALNRIKEEHEDIHLIKIYYIDEDNFTIKGIDANGEKVFTKRVIKDRGTSGFDSNFRERLRARKYE